MTIKLKAKPVYQAKPELNDVMEAPILFDQIGKIVFHIPTQKLPLILSDFSIVRPVVFDSKPKIISYIGAEKQQSLLKKTKSQQIDDYTLFRKNVFLNFNELVFFRRYNILNLKVTELNGHLKIDFYLTSSVSSKQSDFANIYQEAMINILFKTQLFMCTVRQMASRQKSVIFSDIIGKNYTHAMLENELTIL
ncbi:MAG: hypothetical protein H7196_02785 [candidate division SR1 bacterium]|nr:hypothetical protein [candidate division SR1 bacterium]